MLQGLGSKVQLLVRRHTPLRNFDQTISEALVKAIQEQGIDLVTQATPSKLSQTDDRLTSTVTPFAA